MKPIDDVKKALKACAGDGCARCPNHPYVDCISRTARDALELIENAQGRQHGQWHIKDWKVAKEYICSECGHSEETGGHSLDYKYCPICGTKMDGKENDKNGID